MKRFFISLLLTIAGTSAFAQTEQEDPVFMSSSQIPLFNGDMNAWLQKNMQYPEAAKKSNTGGTTDISFVVRKNGSIYNIVVERSTSMAALDSEAVRLIRAMPPWRCGKQNGAPVSELTRLTLQFSPGDNPAIAARQFDRDITGNSNPMPEFNGDLQAWLGQYLQYPPTAAQKGIEGEVIVSFIVSAEDGSLWHIKTGKSSGNADLDQEALRVVRSMPAWKPGLRNGKSVEVFYTLPVTFKLKK